MTGGSGRRRLIDCFISEWCESSRKRLSFLCNESPQEHHRFAKTGSGQTQRKLPHRLRRDDHFIANEGECNSSGTVNLRTLGFALNATGAEAAHYAGLSTAQLYRCFDNATKNHAVSLSEDCEGRGKTEFSLGYIIIALGT